MWLGADLRCRSIWAVYFVLIFPTTIQAQSTPAQNSEPIFHASTQKILLDFVARDKHHNVVKDLRPEEIEIYENGARQTLRSFRYRGGGELGAGPERVDGSTFDPQREINIVSIVFESMGPQSRSRATQLLQELLQTGIRINTWIGVFTLNHRLSVLQPYTTDLASLRKAVTRAGTGAYQQFAKENTDIVKELNSLQAGASQHAAAQFQPLEKVQPRNKDLNRRKLHAGSSR